jgi:4-hydroxy-4-methyl-2-oxoglutarate aldolase
MAKAGCQLNMNSALSDEQLNQLRSLDSDAMANAIEVFDVRLRNTGFTDATIHCFLPDLPPTIGYAATARVRTSEPPMEGHSYIDRTDWWNHILEIPAPRVVVVEDIDHHRGHGAFAGEVHINILAALGCTCILTNGAVRNLHSARTLRMQVFAANTSVSHAYAHVFDFGVNVEIAGLSIRPGDLLHAGASGVQQVPREIATLIPGAAQEIAAEKQRIISYCHGREFSQQGLQGIVREIDAQRKANLLSRKAKKGEIAT